MTGTTERVYLAGGCYFITQHLLRGCNGVISTRVGWMGGDGDDPTEANSGGHAEVVEVDFDPRSLSFRTLLDYFLVAHRADLDEETVGSIYRSQIFVTSAGQRAIAEEVLLGFEASRYWPGTVKTRVSWAGRFWPGSPQHNDFLLHLVAGRGGAR